MKYPNKRPSNPLAFVNENHSHLDWICVLVLVGGLVGIDGGGGVSGGGGN